MKYRKSEIENRDKQITRNTKQFVSDFDFVKSDKKALANFQTRLACLCVTISKGNPTKTQLKDFYAIQTAGWAVFEALYNYIDLNDYQNAVAKLFDYKFIPVGWKRSKKRIANVMYKLAYSK